MVKKAKKVESSPKSQLIQGLTVFYRSLVVGGIAATISKTVVAPIERIKIILQTQAQNPDIPADQRFKGMFDCFVKLWSQQPKERSVFLKPLTYWRGNGANVIRYFPMQAINFAFKSQYKRILNTGDRKVSFFEELVRNLAAGGAAGATGLTFVYPLDLARTRLTSDVKVAARYKGMTDCMLRTFREEGGIRAIYKGYGISICGIIPYRATYFGGYDMAKKYIMADHPENVSFWTRWAVSQTTSVLSQFVAYPFDTVRRRMQMAGQGGQSYKSSIDCFAKIWRHEGFMAYFKGAWANTIRATGCALCLVFYDSIGHAIFGDKDYGSH